MDLRHPRHPSHFLSRAKILWTHTIHEPHATRATHAI